MQKINFFEFQFGELIYMCAPKTKKILQSLDVVEALIHIYLNPGVTHYKATKKLLSGGAEAPNLKQLASQRNQNTTKIKPGK